MVDNDTRTPEETGIIATGAVTRWIEILKRVYMTDVENIFLYSIRYCWYSSLHHPCPLAGKNKIDTCIMHFELQ